MENNISSKLNKVLFAVLVILLFMGIWFATYNKKAYVPAPEKNSQVQNNKSETPEIPKESILGNKDDLISFSIWPNTTVHDVVSYRGVIKGGYFFEANILINVLDANKNILKRSNARATTDWMTTDPVSFEGNIDFANLPKGSAFIEIHNDNPSGLPANDKSILIPIVIQ